MRLYFDTDSRDASTCQITYEEVDGWLRATWQGFVDPIEAMRGAEAYLRYAAQTPCALLLNDNSQLRGPWFDSLDWLAEVWLPQATRLGLRYVAHVVQADQQADTVSRRPLAELPFDLQIFTEVAEAQHWLRHQRAGLHRPH